ncbi:glycosyltransferase family 4 protein [Poseidonibacter lekithochrous]|uniref:glycosyltransferase family 4 protein n=1 Tax=Poseidonibacter TaxID=2321187 RepID=UPI001C089D07|nr:MULTISPECIES: glycosyltransferase family 4 protein [Poseidonibacter]MBU3015757.1 glycosyltransferase family 4 protein [Poseidonibacter lekithochrous]MDO6829057.1 glycosyltransferase family 4 protein [Poseidonibacter sp. 1_MG-2023]
MKITFVIGSMDGAGAQRVLATLANYLSSNGYDITILTIKNKCAYSLNKNIKYKSLLKKKGKIKESILKKVFHRLIYPFLLYKQLKKEKSDIHISFLVDLNKHMILLSKMLKVPVIASEHTNFKADMSFISWIERRFIYKFANAVTVLTKYDYNNYYSKFLNNVYIMPNPLSFKPIDTVKVRNKNKIILAAGSLNRWEIKGFDNLLRIFANVQKKHSHWKLHIAGEGEKGLKYLTQLSKELEIEDSVVFLGFQTTIKERMKESSIFLLTSRYEGFSMVLVEAMSQGCACISFDCIAGPSEIIDHNYNGILIEDQNTLKMEEEVNKLIETPKKREELAQNAIKSLDIFSVKTISEKWISIIDKISTTKII